MTFELPRRTLIVTAAGALATSGARAQDAKPIRIGMTVSSTGTFAAGRSGLTTSTAVAASRSVAPRARSSW